MRLRSLFLVALAVAFAGVAVACFDDRVVAPAEPLPADLAVDRPTVQLFRFARGRAVTADTVRISNNGEGPLGGVERVGGVDYITSARTGWLQARIEPVGDDRALLILEPTYADEEQDAADVAEIVLKARNSNELRRVRVVARTLRGAVFEFSVRPLSFAAVPGDSALEQSLTVRNGGNGTLVVRPPEVRFPGPAEGWLAVVPQGGDTTAPRYRLVADPTGLAPDLYEAFLVFASRPSDEARAEPDSVPVLLNIGRPVLRLSTSSVIFSTVRGSPAPPAQTVTLANAGEGGFEALGQVEFTPPTYVEGPEGWLTVALAEEGVSLEVASAGLPAGDHRARFSVASEFGGREELVVTVSVEAPVLTAAPRTVAFGLTADDAAPPPPRAVTLTNTGAGTLASLGTLALGSPEPAAPWLSAVLEAEGGVVTLAPTPGVTSLEPGEYATAIPVLSDHGGRDTVSVSVAVSRGQDPPRLALSAAEVAFSGVAGDPSPSPRSVAVSNAGGGTLGALSLGPVRYSGSGGWLDATLSGSSVTLTATTGTLGDGTYRATVPVVSENGGEAAIAVTFDLGGAILTASTTAVSFSAREGGGDPADQVVTFSNTGPGDFATLGTISLGTIDFAGAGGWLSADLSGGTLTLSARTGALAPGAYAASVPVASTRGGGVEVDVFFTVTPAPESPELVASPATVRFDALRGGADPPDQDVLLSNRGGGTLGTTAVAGIDYGPGASGWLSASLSGDRVTLGAATGSLFAGSYDATVTLSSANGGSAEVDVTFVVGAPILTLSSTAASFSAEVGGDALPTAVTVGVSNTGAGGFSGLGGVSLGTVSYGSDPGWLAASLADGGSRVDLAATVGSLDPGSYTATVPVNSGEGGSEGIDVTLTVAPVAVPPALALGAATVEFFTVEGGGDPAAQTVALANSGGGDFAALGSVAAGPVDYGSGPSGWLTPAVAGSALTVRAALGTLTAADGPYTATVPVRSDAGGDGEVAVVLHVAPAGGAPVLQASPAAVRRDVVLGGAAPPDQVVEVYNGGGGTLGTVEVTGIDYAGDAGWLSATVAGSLVTLAFDPADLGAGSYTATVELDSENGGTESVAVTLVVGAPRLTLGATSAAFSGEAAGAAEPASLEVSLSNTGAGDLAALGDIGLGSPSYTGGGAGWLTAGLTGGDARVRLSAEIGGRGPGSYGATLPVTSEHGGDGTVSVTLTVRPAPADPVLALSATEVRFVAVSGGASPDAESVRLSNSGGGSFADLGSVRRGTIDYGGGPSGWLSASAVGGTVLTLVPATGGLPVGTHTARVPVISDGGGARTVEVSVEVGLPVLTASTARLAFTGTEGGAAPASQAISFANTGAGSYADLGPVRVTDVDEGAGGWLTAPAVGSVVGEGESLTVAATQTGLAPGAYSAGFGVESTRGGRQDVAVTLTVVRETDPPELVLSAASQRFGALVGGADPEPQSVVASNAGGGTLGTVQVSSPRYGPGASGWLTAEVSGTTITTRVRTGSLAQGTYTATVEVSSDGGAEVLEVSFAVGTSRLTLAPRTVSFGDTVGGTGPERATVLLTNTGGGTFESLGALSLAPTEYGDGPAGWLEARLHAPDTLTLQATTGALESRPEAYRARVPVVSARGGSDTVAVAFAVAPGTVPPRLELSRDTVTFGGIVGAGAPPPQDVDAFNVGGGDLGSLAVEGVDYGAGADGWLSATPGAGGFTLAADPGELPAGTYRATLAVTSGSGGPATLEAVLRLAAPRLALSSPAVNFSDTVASADLLDTQVFVSNTGAGNRASLGPVTLGSVIYRDGAGGWLETTPGGGDAVEGFQIGVRGSAATLSEGTARALIPVVSRWGGADTIAVAFTAREPDRSFDLPTIQLVRDTVVEGAPALVPIPGDSVVVEEGGDPSSLRIRVRNGARTRVGLSGLRVGVPSYPEGQPTGWITGAFLDRTSATFDEPAELFVVLDAAGLPPGRHEGRLVISSESAGLEAVAPRVLRVVVVID